MQRQRELQQPDVAGRQQLLQPLAAEAFPEAAVRGELGVFTVASPGPGVEIARVTSGSAAEIAGLRPGDAILQIDGRGVMSPMDVQRLVRQVPAGQTLRLSIWRDGAMQDVTATLRPARDAAPEPARDPYAVGFRPEAVPTADNALEQRTARLEEQLARVVQELQLLRQEMTQLRTDVVERPAERPLPTEPAPPAEPVEEPTEEPFDLEPGLFDEPPVEPEPEPEPEAEQPPEEPEDDDLFEF